MSSPGPLARAIDAEIRGLSESSVPAIRAIRQRATRELRSAPGPFVLAVVRELHHALGQRWVALELLLHHPVAFALVTAEIVEEFAEGLDSWGPVDAFSVYLAGPAWQLGQIADDVVLAWTTSGDRWRRRAALASTVVLNLPSRGGHGDTRRTLAVCERLVDDRDDMVVKAMSWALRSLVRFDRPAVEEFLHRHENGLAARVLREVRNKLRSGLKSPRGRALRRDS